MFQLMPGKVFLMQPAVSKHATDAVVKRNEADCLTKILIAEAHLFTRIGIKKLLECRPSLQIIGEASNGEEALKLVTSLSPDLILIDIGIPRLDGIEVARRVREQQPNIGIIMLTSHDTPCRIFESYDAGATGYCSKNVQSERLFACISAVRAGDVWIDSSTAGEFIRRYTQERLALQKQPAGTSFDYKQRPDKSSDVPRISSLAKLLTKREKEVLVRIVHGHKDKDIAVELNISNSTAKSHVSSILQKLMVKDRTDAAVMALKLGLTEV